MSDRQAPFRLIRVMLGMAIYAGAASMRLLDALLPELARSFDRSAGSVGIAVMAYALGYSACQLFYGPIGDRVGSLRVLTAAAIASAFAALACALAPSFNWLVGLRLAAGAIAAAIGPLTLAWVSYATLPENRAVAISRITGASILGTATGQFGGGLIADHFGWRESFLLVGGLFAAPGLVLGWAGRRYPELRATGSGPRDRLRPPSVYQLVQRGAVQRTLVAVAVEGFAMFMSFTYVAVVLRTKLKLELAPTAVLVSLFAAGGICFVLLARPLTERLTPARRGRLGGCLAAAGFGMLILSWSPALAGTGLFALGFGFFMLHNLFQVAATHMAPDAPGAGLSLFAAIFFLAQAFGAGIGGILLDRAGAGTLFAVSALLLIGLGLAASRLMHER